MINHHPGPELLLGFAAGTLPEGFALLVATHATMCPKCRDRIRQGESVGGALLYALEPSGISEDALSRVMAKIETGQSGSPGLDRQQPAHSPMHGVPAPLRAFIPGSYDDLPWRRVAPGIKQIVLPLDRGGQAKTRLMRLASGIATPTHSHKGQEATIVLRGSFSDELGRFGPGDVQQADDRINHQPMADTGEDCICLAVTDAPLKFDSLVGKILQPIFGF